MKVSNKNRKKLQEKAQLQAQVIEQSKPSYILPISIAISIALLIIIL